MADFSDQVAETTNKASEQEANTVEAVKDTVTAPLPNPPELKNEATPQQLQERLNWGEPALTIIDVRDREAYNQERITGAIPISMATLADSVKDSLEPSRDIYIYGDDDQQTALASEQLRNAGFTQVAELKGGLPAWKATSGATEGIRG
ncbi:rhodanese-like domain-containing protein [filamentous cyanobacterium CCP5]|nr:rhodanese-like domain-containing protein [filamentous cyanobacterium CCP5]